MERRGLHTGRAVPQPAVPLHYPCNRKRDKQMPRYLVTIRRAETEYPHMTVSVEAPNEDAIDADEWLSELPECCWRCNVSEGETTDVDIEEDETPTGEPDVVITDAGHKVNMQDADPTFTMNRTQYEALQRVVAYNWDDEAED